MWLLVVSSEFESEAATQVFADQALQNVGLGTRLQGPGGQCIAPTSR